MARVLITRLSSFGDVAMLVPVVFSVAARYPQDRFVVLTRKAFAPLFENLGFNISAVTFDGEKQHKGFFGLLRLLRSVSRFGYSHVADVHDVLRTKIIRSYMGILGKNVAYIDKGKEDKQRMIDSKRTQPSLKHMTERYMEVFEELGFPAEMVFNNFFEFKERSLYPLRTIVTEKDTQWIGIAPFSKHEGKTYPTAKMEKVVKTLSERASTTIFLFGSGKYEHSLLDEWENKYPNVKNVSGRINLMNELLLMSYLDVMISMDSANMHLASLVKTPVVSVWGATHPNLGFYGYGQSINNAVLRDIECRPCSVYGEQPCIKGNYPCLTKLDESIILGKVEQILCKKREGNWWVK